MGWDFDRHYGIQTEGWVFWPGPDQDRYFESEPTGYRELDLLINRYDFSRVRHLVDIGSGKGRVIFYLHDRLGLKVTGLESHPLTYQCLSDNYHAYIQKASASHRLEIRLDQAETFILAADMDCFYLFNPFAFSIFRQVLSRILHYPDFQSEHVDMILYCPTEEWTQYLAAMEGIRRIDQIRIPWGSYFRERFDIYRIERSPGCNTMPL